MYLIFYFCFFFFFKQKTAYEMSIGDWSSDVCSSDLLHGAPELVHLVDAHDLDAVFADVGEAPNDRLDRARKNVHAAHRDHVIDPARDAALELEETAAAGAAPAHRADPIAGAVADRGHAPPAEVGHDQLALAFVSHATVISEDLRHELELVHVETVARST